MVEMARPALVFVCCFLLLASAAVARGLGDGEPLSGRKNAARRLGEGEPFGARKNPADPHSMQAPNGLPLRSFGL